MRNEGTQAALDKYHELHSDITINGQFFVWDDYWNKLATSAAGKKMQDLVQMDISYMDQYVNKGQLLDLTPYIESGALNTENIPDNVLEMGVVGDGNYGIASGVNAPVIFYNKTLLEENGLEFKDNSTLDEFISLAKEVYEKTGYRTFLGNNGNYMEYWSRGVGLPLVDKKLDGTADDYIAYFKVKEQGIKEGWFMPQELISGSGAVEEDPLVYGSGPDTMVWCSLAGGSNMLTAYQNAAPEGVEIGITTIPTDNPQKSNFLKPSMFYSISADTKYPDEAVAVLDYLINSNNAGIYTSLDEMLEETKLDVLHICLPHYLHVKAAETAIENGVNVFMEKPPALTKDEFQTLKKKVQETKLSVGVCFQNRYNESVLEACSILKSGSMGKIKGARAFVTWSRDTDYYTRDRWHGSKSTEGGGVLINQAIHTLDLLTQFMGKPLKVEAEVKNYHLKSVIDVEDTVESYIEFENGPACFFATNAYVEDAPVLLEIVCEKGKIRLEGNELFVMRKNETKVRYHYEEKPCLGKAYWGSSHGKCISDYYACLESRKKYQNDLESTEKVFLLTMDIYESAGTDSVVRCR